MQSPFLEEDPNTEMTRRGLRVAENEKRDSVTAEYERRALESGETEEILDDIAYPEGDDAEGGDPELSAIKNDPSA